jgi:acyl-CoA hydrolase
VKPSTIEDAVAALRPRDTLGLPLGPGQPTAFLHALSGRDDWEDLVVSGALLCDLFEVFTKPGVHYRSGFFGPAERFLLASGADVQFIPADFRRFEPIAEQLRPRVFATLAAPPDAAGYMSLGLHAGGTFHTLHQAGADADRILIVEVNPQCPRTLGIPPDFPHALHVDEADIVVESDRPLFVLPEAEPTDVDRAIAANVDPFVVDGSTLQTGIGGIPGAVISLLAEEPGGDYGIHSEMFTTALMKLHEAGKVSNLRKGIYEGHSITTFAAGTAELNAWLDGNELVRFLPVSVVNAPDVIARNRRMVTINSAIAVDLFGQVVADTIDGQQYSGIGGHEDFVGAPGLELDDRSLLCLPSTSTVNGETRSRIVPRLPAGSIVTTPRHQLDVVVTEHGVAELRGLTVVERARALARIAHPDFREELTAHVA